MNRKFYAGIDPGSSSGALVVIDGEGETFLELQFAKSTNVEIIGFLKAIPLKLIALEEIPFIPSKNNNNFGAWKLSKNSGWLEGVCSALGLNFVKVKPQKWQRELKLWDKSPHGAKKYADRKRYFKECAKEFFPNRKITLATADAYLLAELAFRRSNI